MRIPSEPAWPLVLRNVSAVNSRGAGPPGARVIWDVLMISSYLNVIVIDNGGFYLQALLCLLKKNLYNK